MLKYWLWLTNLRGLRNQTRLALLRHFGTPEDIYYADEGELLLTEGMTREQARQIEASALRRLRRPSGPCAKRVIDSFAEVRDSDEGIRRDG